MNNVYDFYEMLQLIERAKEEYAKAHYGNPNLLLISKSYLSTMLSVSKSLYPTMVSDKVTPSNIKQFEGYDVAVIEDFNFSNAPFMWVKQVNKYAQ